MQANTMYYIYYVCKQASFLKNWSSSCKKKTFAADFCCSPRLLCNQSKCSLAPFNENFINFNWNTKSTKILKLLKCGSNFSNL